MMVMMVMVIMMVVGIFITATSLFERLNEIPVDLFHLADCSTDQASDGRQAIIDQSLLPLLVLGGMLPVVINPMFQ